MRAILAIAKKDFRSMTATPMFFVLSGLCTVAWTYWFIQFLARFAEQSQNMAQMAREGGSFHFQVIGFHISTVNLLLLFVIPALTMKLFAEEKRMGTFDLLLTSPITATEIVLGKFLAGVGTGWVLVLISLIYPLSTAFIADVQWGALMASYGGLLLLVAAYVAIGMFASSLTNSSLLAVIIGTILLLVFWFVGSGAEAINDPFWVSVFEHMSLSEHFFKGFVKGSVKITGIVFFCSVIFLNCFLTQRVVESSRWR